MASNEHLPTFAQVLAAVDEIPVAVRAMRRMRRLTVDQAGEQVGVAGSTVWRIEQGAGFDRDTLRKVLLWLDGEPVAAALGVPVEDGTQP